MIDKKFKNLEEQIEILKYKGMTITDEEYAKKILLRENYFFLSGYRYPLMRSMTDKHFLPGVTFEELYSLFLFDRDIRNIFFKNLLIIENNLKSIFSYQLSKKYGYKEKTYLKSRNFTKDKNKQKHLFEACQYYLYSHNLRHLFVRVDVIEVFISNHIPRIRHVKQVF